MEIENIENILKKSLTKKRYNHTKGVTKTIIKLANIYNVDTNKAEITGLLHDCAKCYDSNKLIEMCKKYNVLLDDYTKNIEAIIHAPLGAEIAKSDFGIHDEEISDAIKYHSTGKPNMSLLLKILVLSDTIEPNRKDFDGLEQIKYLSYNDIDRAVVACLENKISFSEQKGSLIHPLTNEALKFYTSNYK